MTWYIGYAKAGHELEVEQHLIGKGIEAIVPRKLEVKRKGGKSRDREEVITPYLPNYVFMNLSPVSFYQAKHKYLADTRYAVCDPEMRRVMAWFDAVTEEMMMERKRSRGLSDLTTLKPGDAVKLTSSLFPSFMDDVRVTFEKLAGSVFDPRAVLETPVGTLTVPLDDVARAS